MKPKFTKAQAKALAAGMRSRAEQKIIDKDFKKPASEIFVPILFSFAIDLFIDLEEKKANTITIQPKP